MHISISNTETNIKSYIHKIFVKKIVDLPRTIFDNKINNVVKDRIIPISHIVN